MESALFSFGTLMDTELLELVCQQSLSELVLEPAHVKGYESRWVEDDHYPVLVAHPDSITQGIIIRGLTDASLQRIVFFEGGEFNLNTLHVMNSAGELEAVNYFADTQTKPVSARVWALHDWQQQTKVDTLPRVSRYMQCFGKMSMDEADAYW